MGTISDTEIEASAPSPYVVVSHVVNATAESHPTRKKQSASKECLGQVRIATYALKTPTNVDDPTKVHSKACATS